MDLTPQSNFQVVSASSYIASFSDIRHLILEFVGVNKDLANCRFVSHEWENFVEKYLETVYKIFKHQIECLRPGWEELHRNMPLSVRETIEIADAKRNIYENFNKNTFYRSIKVLGKINNPSKSTREGVLAVMYLLVDDAELAKVGGNLDWKFFKKKLLSREFQKSLKNIKPEDVTLERMTKFDTAIRLENVTEYDQCYASAEARDVYRWAINIVEYKQFLDTMSNEVIETIRQCEIQNAKEKEFEFFEDIIKAIKGKCIENY